MGDNKDYKIEVVILKWVKLKETDAIIKMMDTNGCLAEGVAKGVRKPNNPSSSKLETFNCAEVFLAKGRSLDIIKDCRVVKLNDALRTDPCKFACASCLSELLSKTLQKDVDVPKMFGMTVTFIDVLERSPENTIFPLTAAAILKASSYLGFMPSLDRCVICGNRVTEGSRTLFSYEDGGVICDECRGLSSCMMLDSALVSNASALLHMTFSDISDLDQDPNNSFQVFQMALNWIKRQMGVNLKSGPLAIEICAC